MTNHARLVLFVVGAAGLAAFLSWAIAGLPDFGHGHDAYAHAVTSTVLRTSHATEAVGAVTFDYRGFDTLGEETILFAAAAAVAVVLREHGREEHNGEFPDDVGRTASATSETIRVIGYFLLPVTAALALYIVAHGHLTPGGGFQGGVTLAGACVLLYAAGDHRAFRTAFPNAAVDASEALGFGGYVVIGAAAFLVGGAFLDNFVAHGITGNLVSGGTIPLLNITVGLEVAAGLTLIALEYLREMVRVEQRPAG